MKAIRQVIIILFLWTLAWPGLAQPASKLDRNLNRISVDGMDDLGKVKLLAERGNVNAQLKIADASMGSRLYASALKWYAAAADQGALEAQYQKGHLLLFGRQGDSPEQTVIANPTTGLQFICMAATNHHQAACSDMGRALKDGIGCAADRIAAYALFSLCAEAGDSASLAAMNSLALQLSPENIRRALVQAREIKAGRWPTLSPLPTAHVSIQLKLSGVVYSPRGNLAIINKHTLGEGETSKFLTDQKELVEVTCERVQPDGVEVHVAGEAQPRVLFSTPH